MTMRVGVLVGTRVGAAVSVDRSLRSSSVAVPRGVRLGTGVKVLLGVKVGVAETRGVLVGVEEAVLVGMVCVGKGPSRACAVPARVVLMALMLDWELFPSPKALVPRNVTA